MTISTGAVGAVGELWFHVHHQVLAEFLTEPLANRIAYIKAEKPEREVPIRLKWLTPVQGEIPTSLDKAGAAYVKARAAYVKAEAAYVKARAASDKAWAAYEKALAAYVKARAAYAKALAAARPALEVMHAIEHPGCSWDERTLLP